MAMETSEIEKTLSRTRLKAPKVIYVLSAPIVYPEIRALVLGLNPRSQRQTIVLGGNATEETVIHETLHTRGLGELLTYPLAKLTVRVRTVFPVRQRRRSVKYQERVVDSSTLSKFGVTAYMRTNGYEPAELKIKRLELV